MNNRRNDRSDSTQQVIRMGDVLMMAPESDTLTGDIRTRLDATWLDFSAQDIANLGTFGVAKELLAILPDGDGFTNDLRLRVAEEIVTLLGRFGIVSQTTQRPAATETIFTVRTERNFSEMSLRQLLDAIVTDPNVYGEAVRYISSHQELQVAARKTYKWVVPLNDNGTGIDVEATMHYVLELNKPHTSVQRRIDSRRPVWLGRAMGVNDLPLIHPITGRLTQGLDDNGFDWSELSLGLLEAVLWARKTGHPMLPDLSRDVYTYSEQLFQDPLQRRWQTILDDYTDAKEQRESSTDGIRADWPEDLPFDGVFMFFAVVTTVVDYEALVRNAAGLSSPLNLPGTRGSKRGGIYTSANISGVRTSGTVYMPVGGTLNDTGVRNDVTIVHETWEQLARRLRLI